MEGCLLQDFRNSDALEIGVQILEIQSLGISQDGWGDKGAKELA